MSFKNYKLQILIRLLSILVFVGLFVHLLLIAHDYIKSFFIFSAIAIQLISLYRYIDKRNTEISNFLEAILNDDFTNKYPNDGRKGKTFQKMHSVFNEINKKLTDLSQERESQLLYIHTLAKQIQTGIIAFDGRERVGLVNDSLLKLLDIKTVVRLSDVKKVSEQIYKTCISIAAGQSKLLKIKHHMGNKQLSIRASEFTLRGKYFKLISIQDIQGELDEHEILAWQKLIRVLTHEIMNSIAPITSLSNTLHQLVHHKSDQLEDLVFSDHLLSGLDAIKSRSNGLMNFTQHYRSLTKIPLPQIKEVKSNHFFTTLENLFRSSLADTNIRFSVDLEKGPTSLQIDPDLMSQVIINLLKNAKEAILINGIQNGAIDLKITVGKSQIVISVTDNAGGIKDEVMEQMFIPFYTNKPNGSGIGLSVVKQIVQLHHGKIEVNSSEEKTIFQIQLMH